jgi:hypothetical protein
MTARTAVEQICAQDKVRFVPGEAAPSVPRAA